MLKTICIIPARGGSKGVPKKNIRKIAGKPLLGYVIENLKKGKNFSNIIVSTEDEEIAKIAKKFGAEVPFMRPKRLASDTTPMDKVLLHAVKELRKLNYKFDYFVWRDATTPFITNNDIKGAISLLKKKNVPIVCGVYKQHLNPYYNIVEINSRGNLKLVKPLRKKARSRQEAPIVYQLNGLYVYDTEKFLKMKKTNLSKAIHYEIPIETGLMIDTKFEFEIARLLIENKL
ncbi:MAG: acylneuraminate cytidylyltransferase [Euryarchaeota archaeon]|nr:acylneuraminate cytidylyltransferase [Euryarchaeota archaeon]